jgi:hypothetical protein
VSAHRSGGPLQKAVSKPFSGSTSSLKYTYTLCVGYRSSCSEVLFSSSVTCDLGHWHRDHVSSRGDWMACVHSIMYIFKTWTDITMTIHNCTRSGTCKSLSKHVLDLCPRNCFSISPSFQTDVRSLLKRIREANKIEFTVSGANKGYPERKPWSFCVQWRGGNWRCLNGIWLEAQRD